MPEACTVNDRKNTGEGRGCTVFVAMEVETGGAEGALALTLVEMPTWDLLHVAFVALD